MEIVMPKIIVSTQTQELIKNPEKLITWLGSCARIAYQSFDKANGIETEERLVSNCIKSKHYSIIEHAYMSFDFICDRGLSHELVRHRIASYTQESTRYVKYDNHNMEFIRMIEFHPVNNIDRDENMKKREQIWKAACCTSEVDYTNMMDLGARPQEARSVLNNSIKTHIRITRNLRNLREFLILRCDQAAHPHAKELCIPLLLYLKNVFPCIFDDIAYDEKFYHDYLGEDCIKNYILEEDKNG